MNVPDDVLKDLRRWADAKRGADPSYRPDDSA